MSLVRLILGLILSLLIVLLSLRRTWYRVLREGLCSDGAFSQYVFSLVPVAEIHWWLSHLLAFLDTGDTILSFCRQSHGPFTQSSFVGYSEKRVDQPVHAEAGVLV